DVLQNDLGYELKVSSIIEEPTCGTITNINPDTGIITYQTNNDTECNTDYFIYEITDFWGDVTQASVTVFFPKENGELVVKIEEECSVAEETGFYFLYVTISSGIPPFTISGSINKILEDYGQEFILLLADSPYEIQVVDAEGQEFITSNNHPCFNEELCIDLQIIPFYDCLITETQDSIALLTYQPTGGDGNYTFNGNTQNDTLQNGDIYQIEVTDGNGCTASVSDTIACHFTSIENTNPSIPSIQIFPNPNNGNFTLSIPLQQAEEVNIEVFNALGQAKLCQRSKTLTTVERHNFNLDLYSGLYFIRVSGKDWIWTEKIMVE
ncbi:MAG: T9SS type A sorting domain-containing protein, partial [Chitinophagales bacterium]